MKITEGFIGDYSFEDINDQSCFSRLVKAVFYEFLIECGYTSSIKEVLNERTRIEYDYRTASYKIYDIYPLIKW